MEKIFADFNNADVKGRIQLTTLGSIIDINLNQIELIEGKKVLLDDEEELKTIGTLKYSPEENIWVAEINWNDFNSNKVKTKT